MPRGAYVGLAVAACLALSGCGTKTTYKYRIAVIPKGLTHEFWQSIHRGAERAGTDLTGKGVAVEVLWDGPRLESDTEAQITMINQKTSMGIHGLVLAPQNSKSMVPPVEQTVKQGIPVVIIDSGLDKDDLAKNPDLIVKYVATDNYNGGKLAAEHLLKVLEKEGKTAPRLVLFRYQPGSESTEQREQGFLDAINAVRKKQQEAGKPALELVSDTEYAGATADTAQRAAGPLLQRLQKNLPDGIFAVNESSTLGLVTEMRSQGVNKKIHVMGFDSSEPLLQAVRDGDVDGLIVQDPYRMGYLGVWIMVQHLEGYDVSAGGKDLSTGEYVLTRENMDTDEARERFDPGMQGKRTIKPPEFKKK
jgi:ribose transport system substrate-binding protein